METEPCLRAPQVLTPPGPQYADEGRQFQGIPVIERAPSGRLMKKPIALSTGEWLLPASRWQREGSGGVLASKARGDTWELVHAPGQAPPAGRGVIEQRRRFPSTR